MNILYVQYRPNGTINGIRVNWTVEHKLRHSIVVNHNNKTLGHEFYTKTVRETMILDK
jgi:phosphoserine aminotransferase